MGRMERTVYALLRTRETLMRNCREFQIPTAWMLDDGIISKVNSITYSFVVQIVYRCKIIWTWNHKWITISSVKFDLSKLLSIIRGFQTLTVVNILAVACHTHNKRMAVSSIWNIDHSHIWINLNKALAQRC